MIEHTLWTIKMVMETLPFRREKKQVESCRMVKTRAQQWAEAQAPLAAADHRPCRDFFH